ncbi:hypothetical protein JL721_946 [Aureococcus anophagefferens]|nr:hypothetical protein JL721_946 [Aureococcus anophagefferens]
MNSWSTAVLASAGGSAWSGTSEVGKAQVDVDDGWNARFQRSLPEGHAFALTELNRDFVFVASTVARTIVLETYAAEKTVAPSDLGGQAGGRKFATHGIIFKCVDGGRAPFYGDDDAAHKCVGHDLKGANAVLAARVPGVHVALQCVVDYLGYRIHAQGILPIGALEGDADGSDQGSASLYDHMPIYGRAVDDESSKGQSPAEPAALTTLVSGSSDGGRTIRRGRRGGGAETVADVELLAKELRLAPHGGGLFCGCDVEVHRGSDGRSYLVDLARVFPPEAPGPTSKRSDLFSRLLRPEFVRRRGDRALAAFPTGASRAAAPPLSSDAFSFLSDDGFDADVREATELLLERVVPAVADGLAARSGEVADRSLRDAFYEHGVGMRHLGRARAALRDRDGADRARRDLLLEMVVRGAKGLLRRTMREAAKHYRCVSERRAREIVVAALADLGADALRDARAASFWRELLDEVDRRYAGGLEAGERDVGGFFRAVSGSARDRADLLQRVAATVGATLSPDAVDHALGAHVLELARRGAAGETRPSPAAPTRPAAARLLDVAARHLSRSLSASPHDVKTRHLLADVYHDRAVAHAPRDAELSRRDYVAYRALRSDDSNTRCSKTRVSYRDDVVGTAVVVTFSKRLQKGSGPALRRVEPLERDPGDRVESLAHFVSASRGRDARGDFAFFVPLAVDEEHFARAWPVFRAEIRRVFSKTRLDLAPPVACGGALPRALDVADAPEDAARALHIAALLMNEVVVSLANDSGRDAGPRRAPRRRRRGALDDAALRDAFRDALLDEALARNVMWSLKKQAWLGAWPRGEAVSPQRLGAFFDAARTSITVISFQCFFLGAMSTVAPHEGGLPQLDASFGRASAAIRAALQRARDAIRGFRHYGDFAAFGRLEPEALRAGGDWDPVHAAWTAVRDDFYATQAPKRSRVRRTASASLRRATSSSSSRPRPPPDPPLPPPPPLRRELSEEGRRLLRAL